MTKRHPSRHPLGAKYLVYYLSPHPARRLNSTFWKTRAPKKYIYSYHQCKGLQQMYRLLQSSPTPVQTMQKCSSPKDIFFLHFFVLIIWNTFTKRHQSSNCFIFGYVFFWKDFSDLLALYHVKRTQWHLVYFSNR